MSQILKQKILKKIICRGSYEPQRKERRKMKLKKVKQKVEETLIEMLKNKPALMAAVSYAVSVHDVYAADPLAPLKKLSTLITSVVAIYGGIQAAIGIMEAGKSMGNHDSTGLTNGLMKAGGGALMCFVGAVLTYMGLNS